MLLSVVKCIPGSADVLSQRIQFEPAFEQASVLARQLLAVHYSTPLPLTADSVNDLSKRPATSSSGLGHTPCECTAISRRPEGDKSSAAKPRVEQIRGLLPCQVTMPYRVDLPEKQLRRTPLFPAQLFGVYRNCGALFVSPQIAQTLYNKSI